MSLSGSQNALRIRPAAAPDLRAIVTLERLSFANPAERFESRKISYLLNGPRVVSLVAERSDTVIGWAAGFCWLRTPQPWGRLYALAVHSGARGARVGEQLARHMMAELRQRGAGPIFLEVRAGNDSAIRLYRRLGFQYCKDLPHYYSRQLHGVRMVHSPQLVIAENRVTISGI